MNPFPSSLPSPNRLTTLLVCLVVFLVCIKDGAILSPDSATYINHSIFRMGLYPLLISSFQYVFKGYALQTLVSFQLIFTLCMSYLLTNYLRRLFHLPSLMYWLIITVFLSPLLVFSAGNEVLSEGMAYPLFLWASYFLLKGISENSIKDLLLFSLTTFFLVFTRQQYVFFYGVGIVVCVYFAFFQKEFQKKGKFLLSLILSLSSFVASERLYHYAYHGHFSGTPFTGIELVIRPLFIATEDSYKSFDDSKQRLYVQTAVQTILEKNLMDRDPSKRELNSFALNCNAIRYGIALPLAENTWSKTSLEEISGRQLSDFEFHQTINSQLISISLNLIKHDPVSYLKSYIKDVIRGVGGYILFGFVLLVCLMCSWHLLYTQNNLFTISFILASLIHFGNVALVCLFEYSSLMRYIYSTGCLLFCWLLILAYQFSKSNACAE